MCSVTETLGCQQLVHCRYAATPSCRAAYGPPDRDDYHWTIVFVSQSITSSKEIVFDLAFVFLSVCHIKISLPIESS